MFHLFPNPATENFHFAFSRTHRGRFRKPYFPHPPAGLAGDIAGLVAGQKQNRLGDLFWAAVPRSSQRLRQLFEFVPLGGPT